MGLEDAEVVDYGSKAASSIPCSICLEDVTDYGDRAWAKLHCGHQFHLDCIGSAFNAKGVMQCPNCRKIEKGQWLYADGGRPYPELQHIDDLVNDEDLYDLSYSETIWCPYDSFAQLTSAFDDVEYPTTAYHDVVGQHAVVSAHATTVSSSATHICPYIAYVQPIHPSTSTANVAEGPRYNNNNNHTSQWNIQSALGENPNSYGLQYHTIPTPTGPTSRIGDLSMPYRPQRTNADMSRSGAYAHPVFATQSSARPPSSSMNRGYPGSGARAGERSQPYLQQPVRAPTGAGPWLNAQLGASSDHYYVSASGSSTGRSFQEAESPMMNLFHHIWESDPPHQHPVERVPYPFHQAGGDGGGAAGFRQRHGLQSQNQYWL